MFTIDDRELKKIAQNLKNTHKYAYPDAVRSTLNSLSYQTSVEYKKNVPQRLISRNRGYLKTISYNNCDRSIKDVDKMEAIAGQREKFFGKKIDGLRKQEFGETITAKNKHIVKPTQYARGGSYKKLVRKENLMSQIKVKRISDLVKNPAKSEFKEFRQAIGYIKHNPGKKIHFLPSRQSNFGINGIAELSAGGNKSAKFVYSLKGKTQKFKATPILKPAGEKIGAKSADIFKHEAQRRITQELSKGLKGT